MPETESSSSAQSSRGLRGLLYILVSAFSFWFGWSLSKVTPIHKSGNGTTPQDDTGKESNGAPKELPIITNPMPSPPSHNKSEYRLYAHTPWWKTVAELIGVGAVIWYAYITHSMWKEMQSQTTIQQQTFINSERSWVGQSGPMWLEFFTGNDKRIASKIHVTLENFGHSPALGVVAVANLVEHDRLMQAADQTCNFARAEAGFKVPGMFTAPSSIPLSGQTIFPQQKWGEEIEDSPVNLNATVLYAVGCVIYRDDISDGIWWTRFCQETSPLRPASTYKAGEPLNTCNVNNETGKYEKPNK